MNHSDYPTVKLEKAGSGYTFTNAEGEVFHVYNEGKYSRAVEGTSRHWTCSKGKELVLSSDTLKSLRYKMAKYL